MERPENQRAIGKKYAREIFSRLPLNTQLTLKYLSEKVSSWLPRLKNGAWRPLMVGILALQMAACKQTRGFEDQPPPSTTPIVEPYHPQPTPELTPISPLEPTPTPEPTPIATPGPTISGETLTISDSQLELREFDGEAIAQLINASEKGWQVITNDKGKVSFFSGEVGKEAQIVVLAQGPEKYQFDYKNQLWRGENNQVFIPDILLPGGWNEVGIFFLIKDIKDNGNYRIGAIYPPDKVAQISDKSNLEILPDGSGLYVGSPKNYELQEGQQMRRDKDGIRLTNPDGSYLLMITSWSQIISPNQLYQAGAFAGPFETQPTLPYPTDEIVQQLGITDYQVVNNHPVALQTIIDQQTGETHQYIVAQAITNKEGKFTGWQKTIPFAVETGLVVPHPQETNPELFDLKKSDAPIPQFVNAIKMAGIEVDPQNVADNLQYQTITGADGKQYVIGTFNFDPNPNKKGGNLEGLYTLLIWDAEKGWQKPDMKKMFNLAGIKYVGALMDAGNLYPNIVSEFNTQVIPFYLIPLGEDPKIESESLANERKEINWRVRTMRSQYFYPHGLIAHPNQNWAKLSPDEKRQLVLSRLKRLNQVPLNKVIYLNIYGETHESRFSMEDMKMIVQEAKNMYPNLKLVYADTDNHYQRGMWTNYTRNMIKQIPEIDVVAVEMHLAQWPFEVRQLPTHDDIVTTLRSFGKEIVIQEFDCTAKYLPGDEEEKLRKQAEISYESIRGALESGVVTAINFWGLTDKESWYNVIDNPENKRANALPFDWDGNPKFMYYAIHKAIVDYLLSQQQLK